MEKIRTREVIAAETFRRQCRLIYETFSENELVSINELNEILQIRNASRTLKKALDEKRIVGPELRKLSKANFPEYMYFANCKDPDPLYRKYRMDERVIFHALMYGFANLWVISKEEMDIEGDVIVDGLRSDYYVAFAPDYPWDHAIQTKRKEIWEFNLNEYAPKGYIKTHSDEVVKWTEKEEIMYRHFRGNLRKPFAPLLKDYHISRNEFREWLERLPECCTIATSYFPEGISEYEPYLFLFETDYEDFVIEVFSGLPTSSRFFKVSDILFLYTHVPKKYIKGSDLETEPNRLTIPSLTSELFKRGIIRRGLRGPIETYWVKDL